MLLHESSDEFVYHINSDNVLDVLDSNELIDILFDEYGLYSEHSNSDETVVVYTYSDNDVRKLKDCLTNYGMSLNDIRNIIDEKNIKENKKYNKNMRLGRNRSMIRSNRANESVRRLNRMSRFTTINESYKINMFGDFDPIFETKDESKSDSCNCKFNGKLISKMSKVEKSDVKKQIREDIKDLKADIRMAKKNGKPTKMLENKLKKLEYTLECLMGKCEKMNESVSTTFMRRGRLFESDDQDSDDDNFNDDSQSDDQTADTSDTSDTSDTADDKDEYENVEMKAVVLTVLKKNVETVKSAMIDAGVAEDDVNVDEMDDDAADDDKVDIRVDVNSIDALKTYLESVGINLEDELDGEIVNSDDTDDNSDTDDSSDNSDSGNDDFNDEDFDSLFAEE